METKENSSVENNLSAPIAPVAPAKRGRPSASATPIEKVVKAKDKTFIIKDSSGEEVEEDKYFFGGKAPSGFERICGKPVEREDLLEVFNKIFNPKDGFLFYKTIDKEIYLVIVPIKNSTVVGEFNNSFDGDFQKHAISFIGEGSVNLDTLKLKLKRILPFCKFSDR